MRWWWWSCDGGDDVDAGESGGQGSPATMAQTLGSDGGTTCGGEGGASCARKPRVITRQEMVRGANANVRLQTGARHAAVCSRAGTGQQRHIRMHQQSPTSTRVTCHQCTRLEPPQRNPRVQPKRASGAWRGVQRRHASCRAAQPMPCHHSHTNSRRAYASTATQPPTHTRLTCHQCTVERLAEAMMAEKVVAAKVVGKAAAEKVG